MHRQPSHARQSSPSGNYQSTPKLLHAVVRKGHDSSALECFHWQPMFRSGHDLLRNSLVDYPQVYLYHLDPLRDRALMNKSSNTLTPDCGTPPCWYSPVKDAGLAKGTYDRMTSSIKVPVEQCEHGHLTNISPGAKCGICVAEPR